MLGFLMELLVVSLLDSVFAKMIERRKARAKSVPTVPDKS
jgi:hypothetical protein